MNDRNRLSHMNRRARQLGLYITKSRSRDPNAPDHGMYALIDDEHSSVVLGGSHALHGVTLSDIEAHLARLEASAIAQQAVL